MDYELARLAGRGDLLAQFARRAREAGMEVHQAEGAGPVGAIVARIIRRIEARRVLIDRDGVPARSELLAALMQSPAEVLVCPVGEAEVFAADAGITGVQWAIAETGSVVLRSGAGRCRLTSLAPPVHVAILTEGQILPDLLDWAVQVRSGPHGLVWAYEVLVTGPSKTSDIELNPVVGVHGPEMVHVVVIRSDESD
ncbi:MAG: lactate utilization protein C [Phycisphaerae bacterium]